MVRQWPAWCTWSLGYAFMALGGLTKGPQAPAYFLGAVVLYPLCTGQWRRLFSIAHLIGIGVGIAILAAWHVPYYLRVGMLSIACRQVSEFLFAGLGNLEGNLFGAFCEGRCRP